MTGHDDDRGPDLLAGMRTGDWLDRQDFPPLSYAVPGVIPEGSVLTAGAPKVGKSWLCLDVGLAVALGGRTLGIAVGDPRPVLYLALEDGDRRLQDRCRHLLGPRERIPAAFMYLTAVMPGAVIDTVHAWLGKYGTEHPLVILDTLGRVMPPAQLGESQYQRDYRIGATLKRAADEHPGATLWVNHHDRKATSEDWLDRVSGTNGLAGAADAIVVVTRPRGEPDGLIAVTGRDVTEGEYAVTFTEARWSLDGADLHEAAEQGRRRKLASRLGDRSAEILAAVNDSPHGIRPLDIAARLSISNNDAGSYLRRLAAAGHITKVGRGHYVPLSKSLSEVSETPIDTTRNVLGRGVMSRERDREADSHSSDTVTTRTRTREAGRDHCVVCRTALPPGQLYCSRQCAETDQRDTP